jgi:hypothetical protein
MPARRRRSVALALVATAALSPVALAHAASLPTIDVWMGKTRKKSDQLQIVNQRGRKAVSISITATCLSTTGDKVPTAFSATGRLSGGRVSVTNKRAGESGADATLTVRATLPTTRAATGTISWKQATTNNMQACSGTDSFKLKHVVTHGG